MNMCSQVGGCVTLAGSDYLQIASPINFNSYTQGISFSAWFRYTGPSEQRFPKIMDFGKGQDQDNVIIQRNGYTSHLWVGVRLASGWTGLEAPNCWFTGVFNALEQNMQTKICYSHVV
jgi:hypothetical protein